MRRITDEELMYFADMVGVPYEHLQTLYAMEMLKPGAVLNKLIVHDYHKLKRMDRYLPSHIRLAIANKYQVSPDKVQRAVANRNITSYYCENCNKKIGKWVYATRDGLCDECYAKGIPV